MPCPPLAPPPPPQNNFLEEISSLTKKYLPTPSKSTLTKYPGEKVLNKDINLSKKLGALPTSVLGYYSFTLHGKPASLRNEIFSLEFRQETLNFDSSKSNQVILIWRFGLVVWKSGKSELCAK